LQLAAKCRTTPQTIQRLEVASMTISLDWVERIAKALDVKPISFFDTDASMVKDVRGAAKILQEQVSVFLDMTRPD